MKTIISCVVDDQPKFLMQLWNLVCSLMAVGDWPKPGVELFIHHTRAVDPKRLAMFARLGARLRLVEPWGSDAARYCNKLRQLETPELQEADVIILLDTDIVIARPLGPLMSSQTVCGKIVDHANPPEETWQALLKGTAFEGCNIFQGIPTMSPDARTPNTNFNGGLYILPRAAFMTLKTLWPKWSDFCLENGDCLEKFAHHADQIGFALAMLEAGLDFKPLSLGENFPLHFARKAYEHMDPCDLSIIHYHWRMNDHGLPLPLGIEWIDAQVRAVSQRITAQRRTAFDNAIFWDFRYDAFPQLGSGVGSRGNVLAYKRSRLAPFFRIFADQPVVDVGCGDLETTRYAPLRDYKGLDLSKTALAIAQEKRPDWRFSSDSLADLKEDSAALALCLDVLIHQSTPDAAQTLVNHLVRVATDAVIVSGYRSTPEAHGIVFPHPPVMEMLRANPQIERVFEIGQYRGLSLAVGQKKSRGPANPSDVDLEKLAWGMANSSTPDLLADLVRLSRDRFTFFPTTITRTIEYPWLASRMQDCAGQRILDLGAGVSALPIWLAERGANMVTVDFHTIIRDLENRIGWNEWGFLDFSLFDPRIASFNMDMCEFYDDQGFDLIYSASVIEHMPAVARRRIIQRLTGLLRPDGRLLLTLDLIPGTNRLWLLSEGKEVDPPDQHGHLEDIIAELAGIGLDVFEQSVMRDIPGSRTDIVMMDLRPSRHRPFPALVPNAADKAAP